MSISSATPALLVSEVRVVDISSSPQLGSLSLVLELLLQLLQLFFIFLREFLLKLSHFDFDSLGLGLVILGDLMMQGHGYDGAEFAHHGLQLVDGLNRGLVQRKRLLDEVVLKLLLDCHNLLVDLLHSLRFDVAAVAQILNLGLLCLPLAFVKDFFQEINDLVSAVIG
jgi:hypothetical protein